MPHLLLVLVLAQLSDCAFHLLQALVEFLNLVSITFLAVLTIGKVAHDIVLVELHQSSQELTFVLRVHNLLHVLLEFTYDGLLFLGARLLHCDLVVDLINFVLHFTQARSVVLQLGTLVFEVLLKFEQLVLQVIDLDLLGLQALLHLFRPVSQHMLRLLQILDLELVLVEISLTLV